MPDPEIVLGQTLTTACKKVGDHPLLQLFRDPGSTLQPWKDNDVVSGHLAQRGYTNNWFSAMAAERVLQCFDPGGSFSNKYSNGLRGQLLRLAVKGVPALLPLCFSLGVLDLTVRAIDGVCVSTWPVPGETLHYRGAELYPSFLDPTDPAKGGSGYVGYDRWAFKRGSGSSHGTCSTGLAGLCGTVSYASQGAGQTLATGAVVGGVITGFPPNDSFTELVDFTANLTGCCVAAASAFPLIVLFCTYTFCLYPEGGPGPTDNPGP